MAAPKPKPKPKAAPGRGGLRDPPGGRPRERGLGGINWAQVRRDARLGADRDTIVIARAIKPELLKRPEIVQRLQEEMQRGAALHKIDLLQDIDGLRNGSPGSVNATLASLRQALGWDRPDSARSKDRARPDNEAAVAEVERMLKRFRAAR